MHSKKIHINIWGNFIFCVYAASVIFSTPMPAFGDFEDVSSSAGISYVGKTYGASWGDFDGDGWPDVWVSNHAGAPSLYRNNQDGTFTDIAHLVWPGRFVDPLTSCGPTTPGVCLADTHGGAWGDFDNDGDQDLLEVVGGSRGNHLFVNDNGELNEMAHQYGIALPGARSRSPAWLDWNVDGLIDPILTHELNATAFPLLMTNQGSEFLDSSSTTELYNHSSTAVFLADLTEDGRPEIILTTGNKNAGLAFSTTETPFVDVMPELQTPGQPLYIGCSDSVYADFNGDGRTDIFSTCGGGGREVVQRNDSRIEAKLSSVSEETAIEFDSDSNLTVTVYPNFAFYQDDHLRLGEGGIVPAYTNQPQLGWRAVTFDLDPTDANTHGVPPHSVGDDLGLFISFDQETLRWRFGLSASGHASLSLVITSTGAIANLAATGFNQTPTEYLPIYLHRTDGGFVDYRLAGGLNTTLPCPSAVGGDFDNDSDIDIYLVCSRTINNLPNILLINDGTGNFAEHSTAGGAAGSTLGSGDSATVVDYDLDGFLDLFVTNGSGGAPFHNGPHQLFRNLGNNHHWIKVDLTGSESNRDGIGAVVTVKGNGVTQKRMQDGGFHRHSQNHSLLHFGLGSSELVDEIHVRWPSGNETVMTNVNADQILNINESNMEDSDGDGLPNTYEEQYGLNPMDSGDALSDFDFDGLTALDEYLAGTDPTAHDTDSDGVGDGSEIAAGNNPLDQLDKPKRYETGIVSVSNTDWTHISLDRNYLSPVILTTATVAPNDPPIVTRLRRINGGSFEVSIARVDGDTAATREFDVRYFVIDEGIYSDPQTGFRMEAVRYESSFADNATAWIGEQRSYLQSYENPVVLGQVMTSNDPRFDIFWARGQTRQDIPSANHFSVGRHIGEDPDKNRVPEIVGYVVIEAGSFKVDGKDWLAQVGPNAVGGIDNNPPYIYDINLPSNPSAAFVAAAGMKGINGGWPVVVGQPTQNTIPLAINEDMLNDTERAHIQENVGYLLIGEPSRPKLHAGVVVLNSTEWTTVHTHESYQSMVVVATPNYDAVSPPGVVRIRGVGNNQFEARLYPATNRSVSMENIPVHYLVAEEGVYSIAEHDISMEVKRVASSTTDSASSWIGEAVTLATTFANPVVVGQVLSTADPRFSVFWSRGQNESLAADESGIWIGKHVGEDSSSLRLDETIGLIVIESGDYLLGGQQLSARRGARSIGGVYGNPPYHYDQNPISDFASVVASQSGVQGPNGGWAVLYGSSPLAGDQIALAIDEDQFLDSERYHISEEVHYYIIEPITAHTR